MRLRLLTGAALVLLAGMQPVNAQQRAQLTVPPLPDEPMRYATAEGMDIRLVVLAKGLEFPWSIAFLPNGDKLVVERAGRLRMLRDDRLLPDPVRESPRRGYRALPGLVISRCTQILQRTAICTSRITNPSASPMPLWPLREVSSAVMR